MMIPIAQLLKEHSGLVAKLRRFDFPQAARLVAGLSLHPQFHANTIRIEVLEHLIAVSCQKRAEASLNDLIHWLEKDMAESKVAHLEDPVEDVFIGCINSTFGSYRIFSGVFPDGDFWVERLLSFLADKQELPSFQTAVKDVLPLLKLSEALVERVRLVRYSPGGGNAMGKILVPRRWRELAPQVEALRFSDADLALLGLNRGELREFILTNEHRVRLPSEDLWNSSLDRMPLIEEVDGISVIIPSRMTSAAARFLVERIAASGMGGWADMFYQTETASTFVNDVGSRLDINALEFKAPAWPAELPPMFPYFGVFDVGKPVIMLTYCTPLSASAANFGGLDRLTDDQVERLTSYLRQCATEFEKLPGFSGGLVLFNLASIGRSIAFGLDEWSPHWRTYTATLPEWLIMTLGNECTAMRLWKLGDHQAATRQYNIKILNLAGLLNLFAFWKDNGFRLVTQKMDVRSLTHVNLGCDFATTLRVDTKQRYDVHCVRSHDNSRWVLLMRHNAKSFFIEDEVARLFADYEAVKDRRLVGCVEQGIDRWWVIVPPPQTTPEIRDLIYQLWDCLMGWIGRLAPVVKREWPSVPQIVEIQLELPDLANWRLHQRRDDQVAPAELSTSSDLNHARVILTMPEGFLRHFNTPKNVAEQRIVSTLLDGIATLAQVTLVEDHRATLTKEITRNEDARYFHVVETQELEQILAVPGRPKPLFLAEEDLTLGRLGLADLVGCPSNSDVVAGLSVCRDFLKDTVAKIWERAEMRLKPFDRVAVLAKCFQALDELARDEEHWTMTARSQLALHDDTSNVHEVLDNRRSQCAKAAVGNRILIETAQYACSTGQGRDFTEADHLTVLADLILLLELAHHRDAIAYGFMEPCLKIMPNGELGVEEKFYIEVLSKYLSKRSRDTNERAAAHYDSYFSAPNISDEESDRTERAISDFDKVFVAEFGFSVHQLFDARDELKAMAWKTRKTGGLMDEAQFHAFLQHCKFSDHEAKAFLERFSLPIRTAWDANLPPRCQKFDVYPWRFRRQLSLLTRPLVQTSVAPRVWFVSVPMFEKSVTYWLGNLERAYFPKDFFQSSEMQSYIGTVVNKRGHEFTRRVGEVFSTNGYVTRLEVEMTGLGASKKDGLGDVDVLAWNDASGRVFVIECKRLLMATTVREVVQRLEDFQGNKEEKDSLGRHLRRIDWITKHSDEVAKLIGIPSSNIKLIPLLVTSDTVPMQFYDAMKFPTAQVIPYDDLAKYLSEQALPQ